MIKLLKRWFHVHDYGKWMGQMNQWDEIAYQSRICSECLRIQVVRYR